MDDIFGRVVSIFLAVCIMFGMPFIYMTERAKSARQMYMLSAVTHFVDSVSNTGFINGEMMREFYGEMSFSDSLAVISILHESDEFVVAEEDSGEGGGTYNNGYTDNNRDFNESTAEKNYVRVKTWHDEEDIWDTVEKGEKYTFLQGDYLKVTVREENAFSLFPFLKDDTVMAVYGGCIKHEAD